MAVNTKDKYYTPDWLVEHTIKKAIEIIGKENIREIVEPSAGDGAFIEPLKKAFPDLKQRYYDLYPEHPEVIEQNYKEVRLTYKKGRLTIGNPPFGASSSLWKAFCRKAATNSDYIVYISPASQYKSNYYFKEGELIYSELLNDVEYRGSEVEGGKNQKVRTCLNIYKVYDREEEEDWRIKRLEQDIQIVGLDSRDPLMNEKLHNYDWYLDRFKTIGKPSQTPRGDCFAIKILNENVRSKVDKVMNEFDTKYRNDICRLSNGTPVLSIFKLRDILITNLYPTREERLEQDVKIIAPFGPEENVKRYIDCDFFIARMHTVGAIYENFDDIPTNVKSSLITVRILNKDVKDKVRSVLQNLKEYYKNEYTAATVSTMSNMFLKEYLIKHLYPTREERLEQDVQITHYSQMDEYDFYIGRWGAGGVGKICETTEHYDGYTIKILNEDKRDKITDLIKGLREYVLKNVKREGPPAINIVEVKDYLIKHLYPTREERLEQDVLIERDNRTKEYDFIIDRRGWNLGKLLDNAEGRSFYGIKVLNDNMRTNIESAIKQLEIDFKIKAENDLRSLSMPEVKQQLIKHLYPTREERLEQDISIELDHSNRIFEYHISQLGDAGRTTKERIAASSYGITILNENLRDKFEQSFDLIKQLIQKHPSLSIASGGSMSINKHAVKEVLMNVLYPQDDPQFEDYDYPEVRKPIKIERAQFAMPLF